MEPIGLTRRLYSVWASEFPLFIVVAAGVAFVCLTYYAASSRPKTPEIPTVGRIEAWWKFWKKGEHFDRDAQAILQEGLAKVQLVLLSTGI